MIRASFTRNQPIGRVLLSQPFRKQQFHSSLENTWLGRWFNANAPKGFGKFYRKPGEKPSGQPNSSGGSSGAKESKGSSSGGEKMNMKDGANKKKGSAGGGNGGPKKSDLDVIRFGFILSSGAMLLYLLSSDDLSNQK